MRTAASLELSSRSRNASGIQVHAEVFIRFRQDIVLERLTAGMPPSARPSAVLSKTYFRSAPDVLTSAVYAHVETTVMYIVFRDTPRELRVHVEGRVSKGDLGHLVGRAERITDRFIALAQAIGCRADRAVISVQADEYVVTIGQRRPFGERLLARFSETIFGDVVVGMVTFLLTGCLTAQWLQAGIVGAASVLCLAAWLLIEIRSGNNAYEYSGFRGTVL